MTIATKERKYDSITSNIEQLWEDAQNALNNKDYISAITFLKQFIVFKPKYIDAYINISYAYINIKDYNLAIKYLQEAANMSKNAKQKIDPIVKLNYAYAIVGLADEKLYNFNYDEAEKLYSKAKSYLTKYITSNPSSEEAKDLKNNINRRLKDIKSIYE